MSHPDRPISILICQGTSGIWAGARKVQKAFEREIEEHNLQNITIKSTGDRGLFLDTLVDIINIDGERTTYCNVGVKDVEHIVKEHLIGGNIVTPLSASRQYERFFSGQKRMVLERCGEIEPTNIKDYLEWNGFRGLKKCLGEMSPGQVREEVKTSGLRGRGGAGFPTGLKWEFASRTGEGEKYIICNGDEGDPGAFMDRSILEGDPFAVIEGMTIAAFAIGADRGIVYVRAEYPLARERVAGAIKMARAHNLLGDHILGSRFSFDITIREGAGAFVCGEETALIRSLQGERGMPKPRPPYPANRGLFGLPTVINNVETLANIPIIMTMGGEKYNSTGVPGSCGTKVFALAGKVKNTGLVEVPMGTTIRNIVWGPGGGMKSKRRGFKAIQMGGPSGGCLPESCLDTPVDYESIGATGAIMGSGGMIVMDRSTCMVDMARYFLEFTLNESCGKCPPCRDGLKKMWDILDDMVKGKGTSSSLEKLEKLGILIKNTALCGLGGTAPNPVLTTLRYFKEEYLAHIEQGKCPAHVCEALLKYVVDERKCKKCGMCFQACTSEAIDWKKGKVARIVNEKCKKCHSCIEACDFGAIY